jgi:hypothetical protein
MNSFQSSVTVLTSGLKTCEKGEFERYTYLTEGVEEEKVHYLNVEVMHSVSKLDI